MGNVADNAARSRYELEEEGEIARADYRREGGRVFVDHVVTPVALRGKGVAGRLMDGVVADIRARGEKIVPICSYADAWMRRHPEHHDLLA